ncbi:hypothetical protein CEXT_628741 [Caerostris extrusa]|uniref:Uncharacterized protein n=1 Tax=Caerostris extrusa TaxID=172846 RepID=A0AAV4U6L8_CAEEX|nr:hypothetical protein CEXT_628741 [Caerostris extrusa]
MGAVDRCRSLGLQRGDKNNALPPRSLCRIFDNRIAPTDPRLQCPRGKGKKKKEKREKKVESRRSAFSLFSTLQSYSSISLAVVVVKKKKMMMKRRADKMREQNERRESREDRAYGPCAKSPINTCRVLEN